jgi:hypothetical protein
MKNCQENVGSVKRRKNVSHFTWIPEYVLLLPVTLNHHKNALFEWNGIRLLG